MSVHPSNACAGGFGKCLDVKITDKCNGHCAFCIEKGGRTSNISLPMIQLSQIANSFSCDSVLVLGGEPLLEPNLATFLKNIKRKRYLTTNGSLLTLEKTKEIGPYLDGINISIHHPDPRKNQEITGLLIDTVKLQHALFYLRSIGVQIRINCNLIRGYVDSFPLVRRMILLAKTLGSHEIRFAEIQQSPESFVDARTIWKRIHEDPFTQGCDQVLQKGLFKVSVRLTCGFSNPLKPKPDPKLFCGYHTNTKVLYADGFVSDGWVNNNRCHEPDRRPEPQCHRSPINPDPGCHS